MLKWSHTLKSRQEHILRLSWLHYIVHLFVMTHTLKRCINILYKKLSPFFMPILLLGLSWQAIPHLEKVRQAMPQLFPYLPFAFIFSAMAISLRFNITRLFYMLAAFAIAYWGYSKYLGGPPEGFAEEVIFMAIGLALPLNTSLFLFARERGILNIHGLVRFLFIAAQVGATYWLIDEGRTNIYEKLTTKFLPPPLAGAVSLPDSVAAAFAAAFLLIVIAYFRNRSPIEMDIAGALAAGGLACLSIARYEEVVLFFSLSGLILLIGIIQNTHFIAYRDDLTGLMGRRALNERALMLGRSYSVAMLDVDHFKKFNDTYGHDVGDQVLKMVAGRLQLVGGGGKTYRYGGEEFTIIFPGRSAEEVLSCLENVRKNVADQKMAIRGSDRPKDAKSGKEKRGGTGTKKTVSVTISIGVAERSGGMSAEDVIKEADKALYRAKEKGRNRVCR